MSIRFGDFEVDPSAGELRKHGRLVKLQEQPIRLLLLLLARPGDVVTRERARRELWDDETFVDYDHGLGAALNRLRTALGDSAANPRYIETLPRRGYRFIAPVTSDRADVLETPGRPERSRLRYAVPMLALGGVLLSLYLLRASGPTPAEPAEETLLLVLPFDNVSGDPEDEYLSDGLTDELITQIGQIQFDRLGVIARTSSMAYKNTTQTVGEIGRELGVDYVLEGSVRLEDDRVRVTAQLIAVNDQTHLWAQTYDRELDGILALQSEVSGRVATAVAGKLGLRGDYGAARSLANANTDAYQSYLKGLFHWNKRDVAGFQKAIEFFRHAIELDPDFAPPYAGLADAYTLLASFDMLSAEEAESKSKAMAERARTLDPNLPQAYTSIGVLRHAYDWDWDGASRAYTRAIELNPSYATAYHWYGLHLAGLGRFDEALVEMKRARSLDPLSLIINTELGRVLYTARRYDEASEQLLDALEMDPEFVPARLWLSLVYVQRGMFDEAIETTRPVATMDAGGAMAIAVLGASYAAAGRTADANKILATLERLSRERHVAPVSVAVVHANLGETDQAFAWLEKAVDDRSAYLRLLKVDPIFDPLRSDPRFQSFLTRMGFPS